MNDVKESTIITVDQKPEMYIKDMAFSLNTNESGQASYTTPLINGRLLEIHIKSDKPNNITITTENGYIIMSLLPFQGYERFLIRKQPVDSKGFGFSVNQQKISLNEKLVCYIQSSINSNVDFVIRYC